MKYFLSFVFIMIWSCPFQAQMSSKYVMSFENAEHHEANIIGTFSNLKSDTVEFTMARSSPGRYALHEFVKNVYNVKVTDSKGKELKTVRPNPYAWTVTGHDGTIIVSYTLFANHGDGTYSQVDLTHAHLNMPATFIYVAELAKEAMEVTFKVREDFNWKVATQLEKQNDYTYTAKDLQYFMDSPVEVANFKERSFKVKDQTIRFVLHDDAASDAELEQYVDIVKKIVLEQEQVFGELPSYDYNEYTFLACYMPNATGDGMEHRNSTMVPNTRSLSQGGIERNIGTVAHEFFHCWNVERIRPKDLEPFDFQNANMSGALWFAEGFTSYYDDLSSVRAGVITKENYLKGLVGTFNYVWATPGRQFFNAIEMSYQAPFVDAAKSVDETNRENTFISYYSYGSMLGLALDLSLREQNLNLDAYMQLMWNKFGKVQRFYTVEDLHNTLNEYAGTQFGDAFFNEFIYKSEMPNFDILFATVGVELVTANEIEFGANVRSQKLMSNPQMGTSAYESGFQKGDKIIKIGTIDLDGNVSINSILNTFDVGQKLTVTYERFGSIKETSLVVKTEDSYDIQSFNPDSKEWTSEKKKNQSSWLSSKL